MSARKMLINARQAGEIRVAITERKRLVDLDIELSHKSQKKANVYKAKVSRVEPSLNAVFVDYGAERHGFLPVKEIAPQYLPQNTRSIYDVNLKSIFKEGQEILIQIDKEERGNKGAAVSTYITLAGCYLVLMPNNPSAGGISRRIEGEDRKAMKQMLDKLKVPEGFGTIIRTACIGRTEEELQWDIDALTKLWEAIQEAEANNSAPCLIYQESDLILRAIRDTLKQDISEIIVDTPETYIQVKDQLKHLKPDFVERVKHYEKEQPLFHCYGLEPQIESAYQREVTLPSGASIVVDPTEALVAIDINSAKATKGGNIDETALAINLEAADEIARQLKLRDLGGLIVIDFIDMISNQDQRKVEDRLADALKSDRARTQIGRISRFGLLEMSRQRLKSSLQESVHSLCPKCNGQGSIRGTESLGNSILRQIRADALNERVMEIQVQLPVSIATYLLNEKRFFIEQIEDEYETRIIVIPNPHMEAPDFEINKIKAKKGEDRASYKLATNPKAQSYEYTSYGQAAETPAVQHVEFASAPVTKKAAKPSLFNRLRQSLFGSESEESTSTPTTSESTPSRNNDRNERPRNQNRRNNQRRGNQNRSNQQNRNQQSRDQQNQEQKPAKPNEAKENNQRGTQNRKPAPTKQASAQPKNKPVAEKPAVVEPPKPRHPVKPSEMVKQVLSKESVLSDKNSTKVNTAAKMNPPVPAVLKQDTAVHKTLFSLEDAVARLQQLQSIKMDMVDTKAKSNHATQEKNLEIEMEVLAQKSAKNGTKKQAS